MLRPFIVGVNNNRNVERLGVLAELLFASFFKT